MKINLKIMLLTLTITALLATLSMNAGILGDAIDTGDFEKVKKVIENNNNIDINEMSDSGFTALIWAAMSDDLEMVKYLIKHGANINKANNNGCPPLVYAADYNHLEIVKYLVEHGADINKPDDYDRTPLLWAIHNLDVVKYLIEQGADINKADNGYCAPLHRAAMCKNLETVKYLVEHGADITLKDIANKTAFDITRHQGTKEYLTHVKNYFDNRTIVTLHSVNQSNQLINRLVIPDYAPLAMRINNLYDINNFAQVPQFDDNQYLPNLRHYVKAMQFNVKSDDGLVAALWLNYKQNPKISILKTKDGLKFLTQKNLLTKIEDTKTPFADIIVTTQKTKE